MTVITLIEKQNREVMTRLDNGRVLSAPTPVTLLRRLRDQGAALGQRVRLQQSRGFGTGDGDDLGFVEWPDFGAAERGLRAMAERGLERQR